MTSEQSITSLDVSNAMGMPHETVYDGITNLLHEIGELRTNNGYVTPSLSFTVASYQTNGEDHSMYRLNKDMALLYAAKFGSTENAVKVLNLFG